MELKHVLQENYGTFQKKERKFLLEFPIKIKMQVKQVHQASISSNQLLIDISLNFFYSSLVDKEYISLFIYRFFFINFKKLDAGLDNSCICVIDKWLRDLFNIFSTVLKSLDTWKNYPLERLSTLLWVLVIIEV